MKPDAQTKQPRLVFLNLYNLNFSILFPRIPMPSLDVSLFLGGDVMPRSSSNRLALGYQFTFSVGGADLPAFTVVREPTHDLEGEGESILFAPSFLNHRHHLTLAGRGGRRWRLFYSVGGGVWLYGFRYTQFAGPEAEARMGYRFRIRADSRLCGVVGGQLRLSGVIGGYPVPAIGAFVGLMVF